MSDFLTISFRDKLTVLTLRRHLIMVLGEQGHNSHQVSRVSQVIKQGSSGRWGDGAHFPMRTKAPGSKVPTQDDTESS